jgi:hypothetical protein
MVGHPGVDTILYGKSGAAEGPLDPGEKTGQEPCSYTSSET